MVFDQLVLVLRGHGLEAVVFSLKVSLELIASVNHVLLDLFSLSLGHCRSKRVVGHVSGNTDSGRENHSVLISGEVRAVKISVVDVADVLISLLVAVVVLDDLVKEGTEGVVRVVTAGVNTNP